MIERNGHSDSGIFPIEYRGKKKSFAIRQSFYDVGCKVCSKKHLILIMIPISRTFYILPNVFKLNIIKENLDEDFFSYRNRFKITVQTNRSIYQIIL